MARLFRIGPCRLLSSANITDPLATWFDHGYIRGNVLDRYAGNYIQSGRADQSGRTARADSVYVTGSPQDGYTIPLTNYQIDTMLKNFPGGVKVSNSTNHAIGLSTPNSTITPRAFALVPEADYDEAVPGSWYDSEHVRYIEQGVLHITDTLNYQLPDGDDILSAKAYICEVKAFSDSSSEFTGGIGLYRLLKINSISVNASPIGLAITPDESKIYVANFGSDNVSVINASDLSVETTISVGTDPYDIAINTAGTKAYVTNNGSDNVSIIDLSTDTVSGTISVGTNPRGVAFTPDGSKAYVVNAGSNDVTPITVSTDSPGTVISVGTGPRFVAILPDGSKAYVSNGNADTVTPITISTDTAGTAISVGDNPFDLAPTKDSSKVFVTNFADGTVTPITTSSDIAGSVISVGSQVQGIAVDANDQFFYTANRGDDTISKVNISTEQIVQTIGVGVNPFMILTSPTAMNIYLTDNADNELQFLASI